MHLLLVKRQEKGSVLMNDSATKLSEKTTPDEPVTANLDINTKRWITALGTGGPGAIILAIALFVYQMDGRVSGNEVSTKTNAEAIRRNELANAAVLAKLDIAIDKLENVVRLDERLKALEARLERMEDK